MGDVTKYAHLRLVGEAPTSEAPETSKPVQGVLFPQTANALVCVVHMPAITDDLFLATLQSLQPSLVFDLRPVPSFNIGRLNRHLAFDEFEGIGARYVDVPGIVGAVSRFDTKVKAAAMSEAIVSTVQRAGRESLRMMVLLDDGEAFSDAVSALPRMLPARGKEPWQVRVVGAVRAT